MNIIIVDYTQLKDPEQKWKVFSPENSDHKIPSRYFSLKEEAIKHGKSEAIRVADLTDKLVSLKIRKMDETWQEERTYPKGKDPRETKG